MRNLYQVLGVDPGADDAQVKSAFRTLAKTLHPDLNSGDDRAERRFRELNQAYETLSDPKARAAYDLGLADERTRARQNMGNVAITMFAVSMISTGTIFGTLIWLLTVAEQTSPTGPSASRPKEVVSSHQELREETPQPNVHDLRSSSRVDQIPPKHAPQSSTAVAGTTTTPDPDNQPPTALPGQKTAAAPRSLQQPPDPHASLTSCSAILAEEEPGMLRITLVDQDRAGSSIIVKVNDMDHRATFAEDGRLTLAVPSFSDAPDVQWALADGTPCRQLANVTLLPRLRIALAWAGHARLEMHVMEPNSWLGSPVGHISSDRPNLDGIHGAGQFYTFGQPGDSTRVQLFVVDFARLSDRGFLHAVITLDRASIGTCAEVGQTSEVRYQVYVHHGGLRSGIRHPEISVNGISVAPVW